MRGNRLLAMLTAATLAAACGGDVQVVKPMKSAKSETVISPPKMISEMQAIDKAKVEKQGGELLADYEQRNKAAPRDRYTEFLYYYAMGDRDDAWQRINGMTYLHPDFPWPYLGRALIYDEWGSTLDKAEADYLKFLEMVPGIAWVYLKLGNLAVRREFHEDAQKYFEKAVSLEPQNPEILYGLALAKWYRNDLEGARTAMLKVTEVDPKHFQGRYQLANLLLRMKDSEGALAAYIKAAEIDPKHFESRQQAAKLLEGKGDKAGATEQYEAALTAKPGDLEIAIKLARIYGELGIADKELQSWERAKEIDPENGEVLSNLGRLYLKSDDRQRAEMVLKANLKADPTDINAQLELARIAAWRDDQIQALDRFMLLLDNKPDHKEGRAEFEALLKKVDVPVEGFECRLKKKTFDACLMNVLDRQIRPYLIKRYRALVEKKPDLQGTVSIEIRIGDDGRVRGVRFTENQLKGRGFDATIYGCFWVARFPKKEQGWKGEYSLEFQP